jgi:hypothetical protein
MNHDEASPPNRNPAVTTTEPDVPEQDGFQQEMPWLRERTTATRSLQVVRRAINRAQAKALMLEHLARVVAIDFRGTDFAPPRLLVRVPGGGPFAVEVDDVLELELELQSLAANERSKIARIQGAGVMVDPGDVDIGPGVAVSLPRPPQDESPVDNPEFRRASNAQDATARAAAKAYGATMGKVG